MENVVYTMASQKQQQKRDFINYIHQTITSGNHNGLLLVFKASWCAPCKKVAKQLETIQPIVSANKVGILTIDIDAMKDDKGRDAPFFSFLKTQRVVGGVPSLLLYLKNGEYCDNGNARNLDECVIYPDFFCEGYNEYHFNALVKTIKNIPIV